jgi:hypothetical protein
VATVMIMTSEPVIDLVAYLKGFNNLAAAACFTGSGLCGGAVAIE